MTTPTTTTTRVRVTGNTYTPHVPPGAVYVGRQAHYLRRSPYANPHPVGHCLACNEDHDQDGAVNAYRDDVNTWTPQKIAQARAELTGMNLACWCRLDLPCHVDVLIDLVTEPHDGAGLADDGRTTATET